MKEAGDAGVVELARRGAFAPKIALSCPGSIATIAPYASPYLSPLVAYRALNGSAALAQVGTVPPPPPEPIPVGATAPPTAQQAFQPTVPPSAGTWPPSGQPSTLPSTAYPPAAQPAYAPQPMMVVPAQPAYGLPAAWGPPPSPGLGLIPAHPTRIGTSASDALWLDRAPDNGAPLRVHKLQLRLARSPTGRYLRHVEQRRLVSLGAGHTAATRRANYRPNGD